MSLLSRLFKKTSAPPAGLALANDSVGAQTAAGARVQALMREGNEHFRNGAGEAAQRCFKAVLALEPSHARAHYMLSGLAFKRHDLLTAIALAREAVALDPGAAEFHFSLGSLYCATQQHEAAVPEFEHALRLQPDTAPWHVELATALTHSNRFVEAQAHYEAAARLSPGDAQALRARAQYDLGNARLAAGDALAAERCYRDAAALAPGSAAIIVGLGGCLRDQQRPVDAEACARHAVKLAPHLAGAHVLLGSVLCAQGRHGEAIEAHRKAIELLPGFEAAWSGLLFSMNYAADFTAREIFEAHVRWGARFVLAETPPRPTNAVGGRRIRLGYLSADFCQHPVAFFVEPILRNHDRASFEVFCYHTGRKRDAVTERLEGYAEHWRGVSQLPDPDLEQVLRDDALDIVVDLSGHTEGERLAVLARRVAPVQATYLGYPNTTGLPTMDYRITDARADPPGDADRLHVEKLFRLPEAFLCYAAPAQPDRPRTPPSKASGRITFGSFNNFAKISRTCIELWARILSAVDGATLLIKTQGLQDPGLRDALLARFRAAGVDVQRVIVAPPVAGHLEHMLTYGMVDIALDTFPYHGTTTTMEALWMGVPVVTLAGDRHASRVGVSILSALGLADLVAPTPDAYVAAAVRLARDAPGLERLAADLRPRLASSALTDGARFTAHLERAYREMLCAG
jgi:predicted O-linked N-acetylglucosamine transferase (SPINDLY family)